MSKYDILDSDRYFLTSAEYKEIDRIYRETKKRIIDHIKQKENNES